MKRSRWRKKERGKERKREIRQIEKKKWARGRKKETEGREVLSRGQQINEHAPERRGEQGGKRDREKVTKVHFIEF